MTDPYSLYNGFNIDSATGNNIFSYDKRKNKIITVPALIKGSPKDLQIAEHISFSEIVDDKEYNICGLKNFIHWVSDGKECFIFDNHNHAFFFWIYGFQKGLFKPGEVLIHVDQHTDMYKPEINLTKEESTDLKTVFNYTNFKLHVSNFIQPALNLRLFREVNIIDSTYTFDSEYETPFVLDIDMDIFSDDMKYIDDELKIRKIKELISKTQFITIATSPFFMDQYSAIEKINHIFFSN